MGPVPGLIGDEPHSSDYGPHTGQVKFQCFKEFDMNRKLILVATVWMALLVVLSGCFGGEAQGDPNSTPTSVSEGPRTDGEGEEVPPDVPVMPGAYALDVFSSGTQINFKVDGSVEDVMAYYSAELEALGWMPTRAPDSAIGVIGAMSRENEAGDKVSLTLSYNGNGDFVTVLIAVSRE
jgi:hypothetical protein